MTKKYQTIFKDKSKTQQHHADDVNINKLIAKHGLANTPVRDIQSNYMDISNIQTFHEMQNHVARIDQGFAKLPSSIRTKFRNQSANFAEFIENEKNHPEAWALGLMTDEDGLLQDAWEKLHPTEEQIARKKAQEAKNSTPVDDSANTDSPSADNVQGAGR